MVVMNRPARSWVKCRYVIYNEAVQMSPTLQLQANRPDSIHALVHGVCRRRIITLRRSDYQLDVACVRGIQTEYSWFGKGMITLRHVRVWQ
jgi:hypothetical protein